MKKRILTNIALFVLAALPLGCNDTGTTTGTSRTTQRTTTTTIRETAPSVTGTTPTTRPNADVNAGSNGATATDSTAANGHDAVHVDSTPGGGVDVKIQGEPIRDRLRERRAARDATVPR